MSGHDINYQEADEPDVPLCCDLLDSLGLEASEMEVTPFHLLLSSLSNPSYCSQPVGFHALGATRHAGRCKLEVAGTASAGVSTFRSSCSC